MIEIIAGCPGTGKTTLARRLAQRHVKGVHIETDTFFGFLGNKIDPSTPVAHGQNQTVLRAWCAAARAYHSDGYQVYIDGVIGPWWFDELRDELGEFRYVLLNNDLTTCLKRVKSRVGQVSATPEIVTLMHSKFSEIRTSYLNHSLDVQAKSLGQIEDMYLMASAPQQLIQR